jgi:hypothetical protein
MLDANARDAASAECEQNAEDQERDGDLGNILLRTQGRNGGSDNPKTHDGGPEAEGGNQKVFCFHGALYIGCSGVFLNRSLAAAQAGGPADKMMEGKMIGNRARAGGRKRISDLKFEI